MADLQIEHATATERKWAAAWARSLALPRWLWLPLLLFALTRLGIALIVYLAIPLIPDSVTPPIYHLRPPDNILLDAFGSRWDTGFYVSIAEEGYQYEGVPLPSVAFFPLLPLLMRAMTAFSGDAVTAGLFISNAALALTAVLFYRLAEEQWGTAVAERAIWYWLIFPTAFFGSAIYSESLFLLTAVGAFYAARRGYWEIAALLGMLATLTRFVGLIIAPMLVVEWWMQRRLSWQNKPEGERPSLLALLGLAIIPLGTGMYMAYLWRTFGDPLAFVHGAAAWQRVPQSPLITIANLLQRPAEGWLAALWAGRLHIDNWLDFTFVLLFFVLGLVLLAKKRWSEAAFVLLGVLIPFSSGLLMSQRRYVWVLFPAFVLLAQWGKRPWLDKTINIFFLLGLALFSALFANGYWVG